MLGGRLGAASNGVIRTSVPNSPWCCDYMGPGGLVYYKSFLATGDDKNIYVNFFDDFTSRVKAAGGGWQVKSRNRQDLRHDSGQPIRACPPQDKPRPSRFLSACEFPFGRPA